MDKAQYQSILNKLEKQDTAIPSTYDNISIGNFTNTRPTDLENFYTQNRIRQADSVNSIYNDPKYASTILNSSIPLNQLEKNIEQSKGATLEPYNKSITDYLKQGASYVGEKVGLNNYQANKFGRQMFGDRGSDQFSKNIGFMDIVPAFKGMHMASIPMIPAYLNEAYRAFDRGDNVGGAIEGTAALAEGVFLGKPIAQSLKALSKSLSNKIKGDPSKKMSELASEIQKNQKNLGALPSNKVMANTKLQAPSMVMTDPKVVDEFGFYSEAERQAKMMQQNKGSGAQFQGMLLNKGVKLDEIKALGLDELFKNEKVTKKEIVDTIDLNKFQLIEKARTTRNPATDDPFASGFEPEQFTDITRPDGSSFQNADEIVEAMDTGNYIRPKIVYEDGIFNGFEVTLAGNVDTHVATGYKIVSLATRNSNADEVYLTFKPNANTSDWRNSIEAKQYVDEINETGGDFGAQTNRAETGNLTTNDFDTIVREYAPYSFDEAGVRLRAAAEYGGDIKKSNFVKFEGNTQKGGENYKEFVLSLPPIDKAKGYQEGVDLKFTTHFPEYNPVFHIRTKDRVTTDGKKVLYVEELQSDFGQQGRERGFKLKGEDLEKAKAKLAVAEDDLLKLKDIKVKLTPTEVEDLYALQNPQTIQIDPFEIDVDQLKSLTPESNAKIVNPYNPPEGYKYGTIEEVAKLRQYQNYKALHKLGELTDEFFYQLDLSKMGRTKDEVKSEIIKMFGGERLDRGSVTYPYKDEFQSGSANITRDEADDIIKKFYKAKVQTKGEDAPIPDAPFVKDTEKWTGLAIKRLLQMAEKGEYDHIAFSPGSVQFDRWGDEGLIKYYDEIIPSVARDTTKKMKDKSANMNTTGFVNIEIPTGKTLSIAEDAREGFYIYDETGNTMIEGNKFFDTKEEAREFIKNNLDMTQKGQETFAINITPKMKATVRGGMPLFSTVGGMVGLGALGSMPSTQDGGT